MTWNEVVQELSRVKAEYVHLQIDLRNKSWVNEQLKAELEQERERVKELCEVIYQARDQIANSPEDCLGTGYPSNPDDCPPWPIRDEIVHRFTVALSAGEGG